MPLNPIQFLVAPSATATLNSTLITVTGNVDCSRVYDGTAISFEGSRIVEAVSGTAPDINGDSTITLRNAWLEPTTSGRLTAFNTIEGLEEAIRSAKEIVQNSSAIEDLPDTGGIIRKTGAITYELVADTTSRQDSTLGSNLTVGDANVGAVEGVQNTGDFDTPSIVGMGTWIVGSSTNLTTPESLSLDGYITVANRLTSGALAQQYQEFFHRPTQRKFFRSASANTFTGWKEIFTANTVNLKEFGGTTAVSIIATGVADSTTSARFYLPLNFVIPPTGITVQGTFTIRKAFSSGLVQSGVTVSFSGLSSERMLVLLVTGLTGLSENDQLELRTETTGSTITVSTI